MLLLALLLSGLLPLGVVLTLQVGFWLNPDMVCPVRIDHRFVNRARPSSAKTPAAPCHPAPCNGNEVSSS